MQQKEKRVSISEVIYWLLAGIAAVVLLAALVRMTPQKWRSYDGDEQWFLFGMGVVLLLLGPASLVIILVAVMAHEIIQIRKER